MGSSLEKDVVADTSQDENAPEGNECMKILNFSKSSWDAAVAYNNGTGVSREYVKSRYAAIRKQFEEAK